MTRSPAFMLLAICATTPMAAADQIAPDFAKDVAPVLRKYCVGCHNDKDAEGMLSLENHAAIIRGGEGGAVITPGKSGESKLIRVLSGQEEPAMPPEGEPAPTRQEIALLSSWINAGAMASKDAPGSPPVNFPKINPKGPVRRPINAAAFAPDGRTLAIGRYGEVDLISTQDSSLLATLHGHTGNVNAVCFSPDGALLAAAAGEPGLFGEVRVWSIAEQKPLYTLRGHQDSIYAVDISPDGRLLATGSYDYDVRLWDLSDGQLLRTLENHNGAVFGVAFHPRGHILATASADRTVKLWDVETGKRRDTLEQSTQELYTLAFYPDGARLAAGGADNRIRVWSISENGAEGTNPIRVSQFGHEKAILRLAISRDGRTLVSTGEDRRIKIWDGESMLLRSTLEPQPDWTAGLALTPDGSRVFAGRLDGTFEFYPIASGSSVSQPIATEQDTSLDHTARDSEEPLSQTAENEPNDAFSQATPLSLPGLAKGRIFAEHGDRATDVDLYRIEANAGETWIFETKAARNGAPVDTKIEVLYGDGQPVPRVLLRAIRDSWITFRAINSEQLDCRVVYWEEMQLNQYLYMNGEVARLYRAPQGPDSGFQFYPGAGKRHTYFETTAHAHALDEPCYIVTPYPPGAVLPNNGLPTFTLYYENDDESRQAFGKDSYLTFTAPKTGEYLVRVSDVRGFAGENFNYELIGRHPRPDFKVKLSGENPTVGAESGKRFVVTAERLDGFDGEIRIDLEGLPPGFSATTPITIQAGHLEARGVINAFLDAPAPSETNWNTSKLRATATIGGKDVVREVGSLGTIKLADRPKLVVNLTPLGPDGQEPADGTHEVVIHPGTTVTCRLSIERNGFTDRVQFDVDNLPHGVIVDNIGLNGVLIPEGMNSRVIYLTAADWVPPTRRQFFAVAKTEGDQASLPLWLRVAPAPHPK